MDGTRTGRTVGPLLVSTDRESLARYTRASRSRAPGVPATYPTVWLTHPAIRAAALALANAGEVAFHEDQTFEYREPLTPDTAYALFADVDRQETPARVVVASRVEHEGALVLTMRTVLRLIEAGATAAVAGTRAQAQQ